MVEAMKITLVNRLVAMVAMALFALLLVAGIATWVGLVMARISRGRCSAWGCGPLAK